MNVAPYFVAKMNAWPLPDNPLQRAGAESDERYPELRQLFEEWALYRTHHLFELQVPGRGPVGLYQLGRDQWNACTSGLPIVDMTVARGEVGADQRVLRGIGDLVVE